MALEGASVRFSAPVSPPEGPKVFAHRARRLVEDCSQGALLRAPGQTLGESTS